MQVKEENGKYICLKHNQIVKMVVLDDGVPPCDWFHCDVCVDLNRQPYRMIGVNQAKEMIKEKLNKQDQGKQERIQTKLDALKKLQFQLVELRSSILSAIDDMTQVMQLWVTELTKQISDESIDLIKGLEFLKSGDLNKTIQGNELSYLKKLTAAFKRLINKQGFQQSYQELSKLRIKKVQKIKIEEQPKLQQQIIIQEQFQWKKVSADQVAIKKQGKITYELVNQVKQDEFCMAIAFNNTGTIMVAGFDSDIKVWQFNDGKIDELTQMGGQSRYLTCLIFSKMNQLFVSGDSNGNIQLFKQGKSNKEWLQSNIQQEHNLQINCIILNQKEDQLISCSLDYNIIVWQVNYSSNKLEYSYTLEKKHTYWIYGLSLNESNTLLISCGKDCQIILWIKGTDDQWQFKNSVKMNDWIPRICFINDNKFIVQQWGYGYSNVFKIEDYKLIKQENLKIKLTDEYGFDDSQFPTIYNKKNDVIIQKSSKFVYIIRRKINGQFKVQTQPIDCQNKYNYGSMTENGQHLAIWSDVTKEFRIYKLNYE